MKIIPIADNIYVHRKPARESVGSILLAESAKEPPLVADVIAIGPDVQQIEVGDVIVFATYTGTSLDDVLQFLTGTREEHNTHMIMREAEVLGIIDGWEPKQ